MKRDRCVLPAWRVGLFVALTLATAGGLQAQLNHGIIEGVITDPSGAAVVNATVMITSVDTGVAARVKTNSTGYYRAVDLTPGVYRVHIEAPGFNPVEVIDVQLLAGQEERVDRQMELGTTRQTIEVTASQPLLETASANTSTTVTSDIIVDIPLQGRDLQQIVYMMPGVQSDAGPPGSNFGFNSQFGIFPDPTYVQGSDVSVNGGQGGANAWYLDGSLNVSTLSEKH